MQHCSKLYLARAEVNILTGFMMELHRAYLVSARYLTTRDRLKHIGHHRDRCKSIVEKTIDTE